MRGAGRESRPSVEAAHPGQRCTRQGPGWREVSAEEPAEQDDAEPRVRHWGFVLSTAG